jgi:VanZ family protein
MTTQKNATILYRTLLALTLASISYLATTREVSAMGEMNDKVAHMLAFFVLSLLVDGSWPSLRFGAAKMLALLGYGLSIEIVQHFVPRRSASLRDLAADGVGILLYASLTLVVRRVGLLISRVRF